MRYVVWSLCTLTCVNAGAQLQPISLQLDQFIDEHGQPFFPMIMNYYAEYAAVTLPSSAYPTASELSSCYLERASAYGLHGDYGYPGPLDPLDGQDRIRQDFYEMKLLGFNTVRLVMTPTKKYGTGFTLTIKDFPAGGWGQQIHMDPPYDPAVNIVAAFHMGKILQACSLASVVGLKILLITADNPQVGLPWMIHGNAGSTEINDYGKYLEDLAAFLLANSVTNVLGFDLYGEPSLSETGKIKSILGYDAMHTKRQVCAIVDQWVTGIKQKDPDRLVTIGNYPADVYAGGWDPTMSKIDFATIHLYPKQNEWEYAHYPGTFRQKAIDRYKNEIYIIDRTLKKPFVIAETGYAGKDDADPCGGGGVFAWPTSVYGSEADQDDFFQQTFQVIRDSRACGYAWWDFQDKHWWSDCPGWLPTTPGQLDMYKEDFWGPIKWGDPSAPDYINGTSGYETFRKDMGNTMASYAQNPPPYSVPAFGPVSSTVDMSERFYNPYEHPANTTTADGYYGTVTGHVENQNGDPIPNARIQGTSIVATDALGGEIQHGYHTYTDASGDFEIRGFDPIPGIGPGQLGPAGSEFRDKTIMDLKIGTYGAGQLEFGDWDSSPPIEQNETYELESFAPNMQAFVGPLTVGLTDNETFSGTMTLTTNDVVVEGDGSGGGTAVFKATYEVTLPPSFDAEKGSDVHVYTEPIDIPCDDIPVDMRSPEQGHDLPTSTASISLQAQTRFAEIVIHKMAPATAVNVMPNPTDGIFSINITGYQQDAELTIINGLGDVVDVLSLAGGYNQVSMLDRSPGLYTLRIRMNNEEFNRRIVRR